jgi:nucleoside-diphosphate-sugar epimerase
MIIKMQVKIINIYLINLGFYSKNMKRVLITGGYGALGTAVVKHIKKFQKYNIFISSRVKKNNDNLICDISNHNQLLDMLEYIKPDLIIHLAATYSCNFNESYQTNVQSTKCILDYIKTNKKQIRILIIGSAAEYGMVKPDENPIAEDHVLKPFSIYGIIKSWQTLLMGAYVNSGIDVVCARIFNLYGEGISEHLFAGYFYKQIVEVASGRQSKIEVGNLSNIRDYISVDEAAQQIIDIMFFGNTGEVYHVARGIPIIMREFAIYLLRLKGLDSNVLLEKENFFHEPKNTLPVIFADVRKTKLLKTTL